MIVKLIFDAHPGVRWCTMIVRNGSVDPALVDDPVTCKGLLTEQKHKGPEHDVWSGAKCLICNEILWRGFLSFNVSVGVCEVSDNVRHLWGASD